MASRTTKILQMVKRDSLFDIPKYESTKGRTREEQAIALQAIKEDIFLKNIDTQQEKNNEKKMKNVKTSINDPETNIKNSDYEMETPVEGESSDGSEYIPGSSPSTTEGEDEDYSPFQETSSLAKAPEESIVLDNSHHITDEPSTSGVNTNFDRGNYRLSYSNMQGTDYD